MFVPDAAVGDYFPSYCFVAKATDDDVAAFDLQIGIHTYIRVSGDVGPEKCIYI